MRRRYRERVLVVKAHVDIGAANGQHRLVDFDFWRSNTSQSPPRISTNHCQSGLAFLPNSVLTGANTSMISFKKTTPGRF